MNKKLFFLFAAFIFSGAASAAIGSNCYQQTSLLCEIRCENQFIVCKSTSYEAAPCQNAYNACRASCTKWVCVSDHI